MIDSATKLFSKVSSAAEAVEGGIDRGKQAFEEGKASLDRTVKKSLEDVRNIERSIESSIKSHIRDFQKKWILRWFAFVAVTMAVAAYTVSGYLALRTVTTPPMAAFLLGTALVLIAVAFVVFSHKKFR